MKFQTYQILLCALMEVIVVTVSGDDFLEGSSEVAGLSLEQAHQMFDDSQMETAKRSSAEEGVFAGLLGRNRNTRNNMDPLKGLGLGKRSQYRLNPLNGLGFGKRNSGKMNPLNGFGFGKRARGLDAQEAVEFGKRKIDPLRGGFGK